MRALGWSLLGGSLALGCGSAHTGASPGDAANGGSSSFHANETSSHGRSSTAPTSNHTTTNPTPQGKSDTSQSPATSSHGTSLTPDASSPPVDGGVDGTMPSTDSGPTGDAALVMFGDAYTGGVYNLGPVDYAESVWHNACAPGTKYDPRVQAVEGNLLAGLWGNIPNVAGYCDTCISVQTAKGKSALLRVVTYGTTTPNSIDTSQTAYDILNDNEYPRNMTWEFAECPETGPMQYEFQTESSQWWTSLWVRNARVPLASVEVESPNHTTWAPLTRGGDGTLTDSAGFGMGGFTIKSTGVDGQVVTDTFAWPSAGIAGAFLVGAGNFN